MKAHFGKRERERGFKERKREGVIGGIGDLNIFQERMKGLLLM